MELVDAKAGVSSSMVAVHHMFVVVLDGIETDIHEGTLHGNPGKVTVTSPGNLSAEGLQSVLVRGGGGGTVSFTLCGDAAAEGVQSASFVQCGATRVDGARAVSVLRCRSVDVEQAGRVTLEKCREARLRGGGLLRATRCRRTDVESFGEVRLARCKGARADWCGSVEVEMCRVVDVSRCGAVTGDRCRVVNVSACGSVAVTHAVTKMLEEKQLQLQAESQQPLSPHSSGRSLLVARTIMSLRLQPHLDGDVEKLVGVVWSFRISFGCGDLRIVKELHRQFILATSSSLGRMWSFRPVWRLSVRNQQRQAISGRSGCGCAPSTWSGG